MKSADLAESPVSGREPLYTLIDVDEHCIIILNTATSRASMFKAWDVGYRGLNPDQKEQARGFVDIEGKKIGVRIVSDKSSLGRFDDDSAKGQLADMGVKFAPDIDLGDVAEPWTVRFDPRERKIVVLIDRSSKHITSTTLSAPRPAFLRVLSGGQCNP